LPLFYGTYFDKDSSVKPLNIKKMLKRSKPRLSQKYLRECDLIIYDLHSGNPHDVKLALEALKKGALKPKDARMRKRKSSSLSPVSWPGPVLLAK
jgi:hypothetical protein